MIQETRRKAALGEFARLLVATYEEDETVVTHLDPSQRLPSIPRVVAILQRTFEVLYPGLHGKPYRHRDSILYRVGTVLDDIASALSEQTYRASRLACQSVGSCAHCRELAEETLGGFLASLPDVRRLLALDVRAAYDGDPAATSFAEIVLAYPGLEAVTTYRIAHCLHRLGVPLLPRIMTEYAHRRTGIDIHPGATVGESFFIDHGTGAVIGETTWIGDRVKLYQGVTLGALSFPKDERGLLLRGQKRHPTLEDDVVVYAGATILGGDTVIGRRSVIGGNTWVTRSVPPYSKVICTPQEQTIECTRAVLASAS